MTIRTGQERISWLTVALLGIPPGVAMFVELCSANALTFTMRKFVADPLLITFLGSVNLAFNFLVAPVAAWKSDRIRTPWGRRVPLVIVGWSLLALALVAAPFAPNLWILAAVIVVYQFGMDMGYTGPWNPLYFETVPPEQRGRSVVVKRLFMMAGRAFFFLVLLGQFDAVCGVKMQRGLYGMHGLSLDGEKLVYFTAAGLVVACVLGLAMFVRESPVPSIPDAGQEGRRVTLGHLLAQFRSGEWRWIALLAFSLVAVTTDLGLLQPLLITEQFGYSKKLMGQMLTWVMLPETLVVLPVLLMIADRIDRFWIYCVGLTICTIEPLVYWWFVKYVAVDQVPSPLQIVLFMVVGHAGRMMAVLSIEPLLFEHAPRERMGKRNMGLLLLQGSFTVALVNGMGYWVRCFSVTDGNSCGFDYMSGYLYMSALCGMACVACFALAWQRQYRGTPTALAVRTKGSVAAEMHACRACGARHGLSLVELLVVITTIGLLVALLLPAVQSVRVAAHRMQCANNLKQLALAAHSHHEAKSTFPPGVECNQVGSVSLFVFLLPYLEQEPLFNKFNLATPGRNAVGGTQALTATVLPNLICPADSLPANPVEVQCGKAWYGLTSYGGNGGTRSFSPISPALKANGIFFATGNFSLPSSNQKPVQFADIRDGASNTLLFGERSHYDLSFDQQAAAQYERLLEEYGHWAGAVDSIALGDNTLSAAAAINYRASASASSSTAADYLTVRDLRVCAFGSNHLGGANFAFADGAIRFLADDLPLDVLQALGTRAGGEVASVP